MMEEGRVETIIVEVKNNFEMEAKARFINKVLANGYQVYEYEEKYESTLPSYAGGG